MEKPITLPDSKSEESSEDVSGHVIYSNTEHKLLQDLLVQRDNEINILSSDIYMLKFLWYHNILHVYTHMHLY